MPVIAAGELHDARATGDAADLVLAGGAIGEAAPGRFGDRAQHLRMSVPDDHRTPGADQIDILPAVGVGEIGARGRDDEARGPPDATEGPDRQVRGDDSAAQPTAGDDGAGALEEGRRSG